jgi:hypothetical protein
LDVFEIYFDQPKPTELSRAERSADVFEIYFDQPKPTERSGAWMYLKFILTNDVCILSYATAAAD